MTKTRLLSGFLGSVLLVGGVALAQPKQNVSKCLHPNLAAAQRFSMQAYQKVVAAQEANEFGHAQKAKALLEEVNNELKQAAEQSNRNKRK
ncbi:MAG TPA: hypothetical protein VGN17_25815 [Bryobacteraceae bacterium]|jgi:hypothetical protein